MVVESWGRSWVHPGVIWLEVFSASSVKVFMPFEWGLLMLTKLVILEIALIVRWDVCHADLEIVHVGNHDYIAFSRLDSSCQLSLFSLLFVASLFASTFGTKSFLEPDLLLSTVHHFFVLAKTTLAQVWVLVCFLRLSTFDCNRSKLVSVYITSIIGLSQVLKLTWRTPIAFNFLLHSVSTYH